MQIVTGSLVLVACAAVCAHAAYFPQYAAYNEYPEYYRSRPVIRYPYNAILPYENSYPPYSYYEPIADEDPAQLEERAARAAALPIGRETYYESEPEVPRWRQSDDNDVSAAFLQNLIIYQMARNAENHAPETLRRREFRFQHERDANDYEDEDVRELKALAGKPMQHSSDVEPASAPNNNYEYYDYPSDDSFINWGNKRSDAQQRQEASTIAAPAASAVAVEGQREEVMLRPATPVRHPFPDPVMIMLSPNRSQPKRTGSVYEQIKHMLAEDIRPHHQPASENRSRLRKRVVVADPDLEVELRGLKLKSASST